jgi:uncharacterized protein (UPF0147 family)
MTVEVEQAVELLDQIFEDRSVPKNIRECAQKSKTSLQDDKQEIRVRIDQAVQILDEISEDPNMPVYTRTQIWSIVSILEGMLSN